ncbi:ArsR/SmtB family transcription factor [Halobellus ruber]|uniref:Helix-turn-helix transcriptional regulator n=1 Tax=Halobellus ruber TaxID=2761102 RepID=A0A7J9SJK8_9EURY|nr:helix-turn-helix domain-containing protein [Halobellus ruber]MBB6646177.1 helix-turn-helix transcriptional regulator [Halobellus ruber]
MSALLPRRSPVEPTTDESQVVSLDDVGSEAVFSVLSSEVARTLLAELHNGPATQSELADSADTSIQNVSYHLDNLVDAGLVDVVDQWYSEKGREMDVYAPEGSLVLVVGDAGDLTESDSEPEPQPVETPPRAGD